MTIGEITVADKKDLFTRLRELQKTFDAGLWTDAMPIVTEHYAVMNELKRRGISELDIEWATHETPRA